MPVEITEYVKIVDDKKQEHVGALVSNNIVAVLPDGEESPVYGKAVERVKIHTKIVCDNEKCENGEVGEDFVTRPKTIEFDEDGNTNAAEFVKTLSDLDIHSDYAGNKKVFCTSGCYSSYVRRTEKEKREAKILHMPAGKGKRTFDEEVK